MKRHLMTGIVSVLLLALAAQCGLAMGPHKVKGDKWMKELNLSYEQQEKILEIRQQHARETQPIRHDLQKKRLELKKLWAAKNPNQNAIIAKKQQIVALEVQLQFKKRAMREEINKVLTTEQLKKLSEKQGHIHGHGPKKGPRRGPGLKGQKGDGCRAEKGPRPNCGCCNH
ncbi:MAG TPA: Spy/CpxP family protein refolding chaperone [Firmicutes bacterium]|jgi:Spy/CpxP family protein refolding chaperone|nr:Spy/CpxP family protein refolding chaperone [Bacillota bacterium]HOQ23463.1 Spy/CpxP family protein refolding chaperone [Bacillota bacterium]HPT67871.1 Spy/CpxP family protein refolding chaperone [Bacillota bacterium]